MIICLFAGALALFLAITRIGDMPYRWVFQLTAIALLTAAVFLTTRYLTKSFVYYVTEDEGNGSDFLVTELQGKGRVTVCRIALSSIEELYVLDSADSHSKEAVKEKLRRGRRKQFDYRPDIAPAKSIALFACECGEPLLIYLAYDETLASLLTPKA